MANQIYRQAGYHDLVLCRDHADALGERPDHNGSWTAGDSVGEENHCDACAKKGLDYAHIAARARATKALKKAA
jgi:hypothetical protein